METIEIPEPAADCACKRTQIEVVKSHRTEGEAPTYIVVGRVVCRDCGAVMTQLTANGYDDVFRLTFGKNLEARLAEQRAAKAISRAAPSKEPTPANPVDATKGLPGTEMLAVTKELEITSPPACGCKTTAAVMDRLGVAECRARSAELKLMIAAGWEAWGWKDKLKAVKASAWKAVGLGVSPTDPVRDLLEIALDRAEAKLQKKDSEQ